MNDAIPAYQEATLNESFANISLDCEAHGTPTQLSEDISEMLLSARECLYPWDEITWQMSNCSGNKDQTANISHLSHIIDTSSPADSIDDINEDREGSDEDPLTIFDDLLQEVAENAMSDSSHISQHSNSDTQLLGFEKTAPPPMLIRHPPPAIGRDDDIEKIKEILDAIYLRSGQRKGSKERILLAPDNKISKNILKLMKNNAKYQTFLLEFPVLHLRKSKINTLGSAYEAAGIKHIVKYMKDDETHTEWAKIVTIDQINTATKVIKRLAHGMHISFLLKFIEHIPPREAKELCNNLSNPNLDPSDLSVKWNNQYKAFMDRMAQRNGSFALHREMMLHCDEVVGLYLAERIGVHQGYTLLLGLVKQSLPFAYLNGASQYAIFCTDLLYHHATASPFHQRLKECLFSVLHKGSHTNFASDAIREMEHRDAMKGFRPCAEVTSVLPRMSLIDTFNDIDDMKSAQHHDDDGHIEVQEDHLKWTFSPVDFMYIARAVSLLNRMGGLNTEIDITVKNVYERNGPTDLPSTILDENTFGVGQYLIKNMLVGKVCLTSQFMIYLIQVKLLAPNLW